MQYKKAQSIGTIISECLRGTEIEKNILDVHVINALPKVLGEAIMPYVKNPEMKDGCLHLHIESAALRQEFFLARFELVKKINTEVGAEVVKDIRLLA